jgi:CRP-like cAMP-binding protein
MPLTPSQLRLQQLLIEQYAVPRAVAVELSAAFAPCRFARGEFLLRTGERDDALYFVDEGVLRAFMTAPDGKEHNKAFVGDGMFFVALSAYLRSEGARFDVQALAPTRALKLSYARFEAWAERDLALAKLWRRYMEAHFVRHEAREAVLQLEDARGRYRWFLQQHPWVGERVALYHIASYLGVTNVTLSRVRRALSQRTRS